MFKNLLALFIFFSIITIPSIVQEEISDGSTIISIEEVPEFPGGEAAMHKFISDSITYPEDARELGLQGTIYIEFVVEKNGELSNVEVKRGVWESLDKEAVRVVKIMPRWKPGKFEGQIVRVLFTLPIKYVLSDDDDDDDVIEEEPDVDGDPMAEEIYFVEDPPSFPGGEDAQLKYFNDSLQYPENAKKQMIQGIVYTRFVVEKDGSITNVKVMRGISESLNQEAIRLIEGMPKWNPGKQRGKLVRCYYTIPIKFDLKY